MFEAGCKCRGRRLDRDAANSRVLGCDEGSQVSKGSCLEAFEQERGERYGPAYDYKERSRNAGGH